ncbi:MAG: hypothetical protein JW909_01320 [Planctomycetes bacterium]|nr:hypothetical protein [Planctomycetota bacterium]
MKTICPYCGKQQDETNAVCQFCGASLGGDRSPGAAQKEEEGPATALCNMCMRSFHVEELCDHEGMQICVECLKKVKRRETAFAPAMKQPASAEAPAARPGKKMATVMLIGILLVAALLYGAYYFWGMLSERKQAAVDHAATVLAPVIMKNNEAVAFLHQCKKDDSLAGEAVKLLAEALAGIAGDQVQAACGMDKALEDYRTSVKDVLARRLMAARTLAGKRQPKDPETDEQARAVIAQADAEIAGIVSALVKELRLWRVSAEPFLLY